MKRVTATTLLFLSLIISGCTISFIKSWSTSNYKFSDHLFAIDSVFLKENGSEKTTNYLNAHPIGWIRDSIPFFRIEYTRETKVSPIIPFLLSVEHQRKTKYGFTISIINDKHQIKSLDSIHYSIVDSSKAMSNNGSFIFDKQLHRVVGSNLYETDRLINIYPNKVDIFKGDFVFYYTDVKKGLQTISARNLKLSYKGRSGYIYTVF